MKNQLFFTWLIFLVIFKTLQAQDDVSLFNYWQYYSDVENSLYKDFCSVAYEQLESRKTEICKLKTKADWLERQSMAGNKLLKIIGPFPEKTPLNARVTGVVQKKDYRIEKVIYESIPGYYVTAALFIPEKIRGKSPTILNAIGHSTQSFRRDVYQHVIINLVKKGFIVFAYD